MIHVERPFLLDDIRNIEGAVCSSVAVHHCFEEHGNIFLRFERWEPRLQDRLGRPANWRQLLVLRVDLKFSILGLVVTIGTRRAFAFHLQ